jgi:uncharacterized membrane protein
MSRAADRPFVIAALGYVALMTVVGHLFYVSFSQYIAQDLAAFHQSAWNFAHGNGLYNTLLDGPLMDSRISPFVYLVAAVYSVVESWYTLNLANILVYATGLYPLYRLFGDRYGTRAGLFAAGLAAFHPYTFPLVAQGFRPLVFAGATLPWLVFFMERRSFRGTLLATVACASTHMSATFIIVPISLWFSVRYRAKAYLVPAILSASWFVFASQVLFPDSHFSEGGLNFPYGSGVFGTMVGILTQPFVTTEIVLSQPLKLLWVVGLVGLLGFLPFLTSYSSVTIPYIGINLLQPFLYAVIHPLKQRTVAIVPLLTLSAYFALVDDAGRYDLSTIRSTLARFGLDPRRLSLPELSAERILLVLFVGTLLVTAGSTTATLVTISDDDTRYKYDRPMVTSERDRAAWDLIDRIPEGAPVKTTYIYTVPLAQREELRLFPPDSGERYPYLDEPAYILLDTHVDWTPGSNVTDAKIRATIRSNNTEVIAREEGIVLLKEDESQTFYWNTSRTRNSSQPRYTS